MPRTAVATAPAHPSLRIALGAAAAMLFVLTLAALPAPAGAQTPPASYYGTAAPGDTVDARYNDTTCATTTAGSDGFWQLRVTSAACGVSEGGSLAFYRNGADSGAREAYRPGGVPANVTTGVVVGGAPSLPAPAPAPAPPTSGVFTGALPPAGAAGLLVTSSEASPEALRTGLGGGGCRVQAFAVLRSGAWSVYIEGAPAAVNAAFPASLPATSAFFVRC